MLGRRPHAPCMRYGSLADNSWSVITCRCQELVVLLFALSGLLCCGFDLSELACVVVCPVRAGCVVDRLRKVPHMAARQARTPATWYIGRGGGVLAA